MGYKSETIKGISWMGFFRIITRVISYVRIAFLARILTPEYFGIFAVASILLSFLETISVTGVQIILIQDNKRSLEKKIDTGWVLSIIRGVTISLVIIILTPFITNFFNVTSFASTFYLISIVPLIRGFISPARVILQKELRFKSEFMFSGFVFIIDSIVTVIIALIYRTPSAFVWGLIFGAIVESSISILLLKPRPKFKFIKNEAKQIIKRGKWITLSSLFGYLFSNTDDFFVGKMLSTSSLGVYQASYKISSLPLTEIAQLVNSITLPVFSKIKNDRKKFIIEVKRTILIVTIICSLLGLFIWIFANNIVYIILGENWLGAIPIIRILSIYGIFRSITISLNPIFISLKLQKYVAYYAIAGFIGLIIFLFPLIIFYGLNGVGYAVIIGSTISLFVSLVLLRKNIIVLK